MGLGWEAWQALLTTLRYSEQERRLHNNDNVKPTMFDVDHNLAIYSKQLDEYDSGEGNSSLKIDGTFGDLMPCDLTKSVQNVLSRARF